MYLQDAFGLQNRTCPYSTNNAAASETSYCQNCSRRTPKVATHVSNSPILFRRICCSYALTRGPRMSSPWRLSTTADCSRRGGPPPRCLRDCGRRARCPEHRAAARLVPPTHAYGAGTLRQAPRAATRRSDGPRPRSRQRQRQRATEDAVVPHASARASARAYRASERRWD